MARAAFQNIYTGLTDAAHASQFIAKLEQTAGVTLPATTTTEPGQPPQFGRDELIQKMAPAEFNTNQTLRAFIEQKVVFDRFFFRAFVAMQYFGYLIAILKMPAITTRLSVHERSRHHSSGRLSSPDLRICLVSRVSREVLRLSAAKRHKKHKRLTKLFVLFVCGH